MSYSTAHLKLIGLLERSGFSAGEVDFWIQANFGARHIGLLTKDEVEAALLLMAKGKWVPQCDEKEAS